MGVGQGLNDSNTFQLMHFLTLCKTQISIPNHQQRRNGQYTQIVHTYYKLHLHNIIQS